MEGLPVRYTYQGAVAQVDAKHPPKPVDPAETILNRTITIDDELYISYLNAVMSYDDIGKQESKYL